MRTFLTLIPILLLLAVVTVRSVAQASDPAVAAKVYLPLDGEARGEFLKGPLENTNIALTEVAEHVRSLPGPTTAPLRDRAAFVAKTCPYNGAIIEVVQVLNSTLERTQREDLEQVRLAVAQHWKLLEELRVTTKNGLDYKDARSLIEYLGTVREQVEGLEPTQRDAIAEAVAAVNVPTGNLWVSRLALIRYRSELQNGSEPDATMCASAESDLVRLLDALIALYGC